MNGDPINEWGYEDIDDLKPRDDSPSEGWVYMIKSELKGEYLDMGGQWNGGWIKTWDKAHDATTVINQRFLVSKRPGENAYSIINLFYGVPLGMFKTTAADGRYLSVSPASASSASHRFRIKIAKSGGVRWIAGPRTQDTRTRVVDIEGYKSHGSVHMHTWTENYDNAKNQHWTFEFDETIRDPNFLMSAIHEYRNTPSTAVWMAQVPDDTRLSQMSIPGTHQTLALHGAKAEGLHSSDSLLDNPRCQNRSLFEQLYEGIRWFDLRFDLWTTTPGDRDSLFARHGNAGRGVFGANEGYTWMAVLHSLKVFLAEHATETVIVNIERETKADLAKFWKALREDFAFFDATYPNLFFRGGDKALNEITLGECRGKAILVYGSKTKPVSGSRSAFVDGGIFNSDHQPGGSKFSEEVYDLPRSEWDTKLANCANNIHKALEDDVHSRNLFVTAWNMSKAVGVPWQLYNPIDFASHASRSAEKNRIPDVLHKDRLGPGKRDSWKRVGIVLFDFYEMVGESIEAVIRSNRNCGELNNFPSRPLHS